MSVGPRLSIDFGTSHTVGIVTWPDGRVRPLLFEGTPLLPSAVCAEPTTDPRKVGGSSESVLLVGSDAVHTARIEPARFEGTPKRRIDDGTVLLGDEEYPVSALIAAVLTRVREEAVRVLGGQPSEVILSHPAIWGVSRRLTLVEGARQAGLGEPVLVPEPAAAAHYFAGLIGDQFAEGNGVLVYDFGGGTFDASLVVHGPQGYDVRAVDGIDDLGGLDLDELIVEYAGKRLGEEHAASWKRLTNPETAEDRRHRRMLWEDARTAKERLSRAETTALHIPLTGTDITVTRSAFEDLARPLIERTARTTSAVLRWSNLPKEQLAGVFLVGGSSRIPLVATVLQRELGISPTVLEQPELVVAEGALRHGVGDAPRPGAPSLPATAAGVPVSAPPSSMPPISAPPFTMPPISAPPVSGPPSSGPPSSGSPSSGSPASLAATLPLPAFRAGAAPVPVRPPAVAPVPARPRTPPQDTFQSPAAGRPGYDREYPSSQVGPGPEDKRNVSLRGWWVPLLAALVVGALLVYGYRAFHASQGSQASENEPDRVSPSVVATQPAYQRADRPSWLPAGWSATVDGSADELWVTADEREGGHCQVDGDQLRVTRSDSRDLVGCTIQATPSPLERSYSDLAVEAEVSVVSGCAALWARTGVKGYFLVVCNEITRLYRLGTGAASRSSQLVEWRHGYRPQKAVVGLLVVGNEITVYLCGKRLGNPIADSEIHFGKANAGAYPGLDSTVDITVSALRVFAPAEQPATASSPTAQRSSAQPTAQPSNSQSKSPKPSAGSSSGT